MISYSLKNPKPCDLDEGLPNWVDKLGKQENAIDKYFKFSAAIKAVFSGKYLFL